MKVYNSNSMVKACYDHLYHLLFAAAKDTDKQIASGCYRKATPFDQICSNDIRLPLLPFSCYRQQRIDVLFNLLIMITGTKA